MKKYNHSYLCKPDERKNLLQDAAIEVILEENGEKLIQRVPWYPEEHIQLEERKN